MSTESEPLAELCWRVGTKVPINVYEGDRPICQCQTTLDAKRIVAAVNAASEIREEAPQSSEFREEVALLLHIQYCEDLADEGTPWEVPAEPEPQYFATLKEAIEFRDNLPDLEALERAARKIADKSAERNRDQGWPLDEEEVLEILRDEIGGKR